MHAETIQIAPSLATAPSPCALREVVALTLGDSLGDIGPGWFLVLSRRRPETLAWTTRASGPRNAKRSSRVLQAPH